MSNQQTLKAGDEVVCIVDSDNEFLILNKHYTIKNAPHTGSYITLEELPNFFSKTRFRLYSKNKDEPFDVLKALREGKKVRRKAWKDSWNYYYHYEGNELINSKGNPANYTSLIKYNDWAEYKKALKVGLYWTVREGCDYDDVSEWNGEKWLMPKTNIPVTVIKVGNKIERPNYD